MKSIFFLTLFFSLSHFHLFAQADISITDQQSTAIDELANRYASLNRFNGVVLIADRKKNILFEKYYGMADYEASMPFTEETAFKVGGITELYTKAILKKMEEEGLIKSYQTITHYLPRLKSIASVDDLINRRIGFGSIEEAKKAHPDTSLSIIQLANLVKPDKSNQFSDLAYNILGLLIEKVSNKSYQQAIETYLSDLELTHTFYQGESAKVAKGYTGYQNLDGKELVLTVSPSYNEAEAFSSTGIKTTAQDLLKFSNTLPVVYKFGYLMNDGFSYCLSKDANGNYTRIILSNYRHPVAEEMTNSINAILNGDDYKLPLLRKPISIDAKVLKDYHGTYQMNEHFSFNVTAEEEVLYIQMGPDKQVLYPQSESQFYLLERDAAIEFIRDENNQVTAAILKDGFIDGQTIEKIK